MKSTPNKEHTMKQITATLAVTFALAASVAAGAGAEATPTLKHFHGIGNPTIKHFHGSSARPSSAFTP